MQTQAAGVGRINGGLIDDVTMDSEGHDRT
jgi:hypothetical protein